MTTGTLQDTRKISTLRRRAAEANLAADEATEALLSVPRAGELAAWRAQYDALQARDRAVRALRRALDTPAQATRSDRSG